MLVYNFDKEFLGIDEDDLLLLGFSNLDELLYEVNDFADLFVKQPGYIYNFVHVHWIDFILCSTEETKAIIHAKNKNYQCSKAHLVYLDNLMELKDDGSLIIKQQIEQESSIKIEKTIIEPIVEDTDDDTLQIKDDLKLNIEEIKDNDELSTYVYDPNIASEKLGLPLDLIEEFIQDFIHQANDFKDKLYTALHENDIILLKSLSHKLKGVAANLHIDEAYQTLNAINSSDDIDLIASKLDTFYEIISKLSDKDNQSGK